MTEYNLITATNASGEQKVFQGSIGRMFIKDEFVQAYIHMDGERKNSFGKTYQEVLKQEGWTVQRIEPMPENWVTKRKEWDLGHDRVVLEISDTLCGFKWRLRVNGDEGRWTKAQEATSLNHRYAYFGDYWEGYFPTGKLVKLDVVSDAVFLVPPAK